MKSPVSIRSFYPVIAALSLTACSVTHRQAANDNQNDSSERREKPAKIYYIEQGRGKEGGTLNITCPRDLSTIDLQRTAGPRNGWYGRLLFDSLVYLDEEGQIQPWLAKSWTISPDGKTYTFFLRNDVTFSDGVKFNAEALRINLARIRDPATQAAVATAYIEPYISGKVLDEYTFQATLSEPYEPFLHVLGLAIMGMYSPKQIVEAPKTLASAPIGSGPFVLDTYRRQVGISFVKRKDYNWSPPYIKHQGGAYLNRIDVKFVPEAMVSRFALESGQFDMTVDALPQIVPSLAGSAAFVLSGRVLRGNPVAGPLFNTQQAPLNDVRIRQAIAHAIDREGIVQLKGFGLFQVKSDYLAGNTADYDPSCQGVLNYDPAKANRLLDNAGWTAMDHDGYRTKSGQRLSSEILVSSASTSTSEFVAIQSDLRKVGFELKISLLPVGDYIDRRNKGDYQMLSLAGLHTNTPDALFIYFHSSQIPTGNFLSNNFSRLRDPALDDFLSRARHSTNPALSKDLYSKAQHRLVELVPSVPLYENTEVVAYNKQHVKGVIYDTSHDLPYLITAWLSTD